MCHCSPGWVSFSSSESLEGENVRSTARVLDVRIWIALQRLFDIEPRLSQIAEHLVGAEENEIHLYRMAPQGFQVHHFVADVKRHQQSPAGTHAPPELAQRASHARAGNVNNRVEGDDSRP